MERGAQGALARRGRRTASPLNIGFEATDRQVAEGRGEHVAFRFVSPEGRARLMTYAELARLSNRFAHVLIDRGVTPGETVFLLAPRIPELYIAALGALKARAIVCILFTSLGDEPLRTRLTKGRCRLLVTTSALAQRRAAAICAALPDTSRVLVIDEDEGTNPGNEFTACMASASEVFDVPTTDPETPAFLHFTGGTTGSPKAVIHVHGAAAVLRSSMQQVFDLQESDVYWCTADPGWVFGLAYGLMAPLLAGVSSVVDAAKTDAARTYQLIAEHKVSILYTAPTALRMMMQGGIKLARGYDLRSLRLIASAGEALHPRIVRWGRQALNLDIHDTWWQTETGAIAIATTAHQPVTMGAIGWALPDVDAAVALRTSSGTLQLVNSPNKVGELVLKRSNAAMFRGYLDEPERYRQSFVGDWYLTGDLVSRDLDGRFWFVSRSDDVIKCAGHLVSPSEVETSLVEHPAIVDAGVIGKPDPLLGETVKAFVTLQPGVAGDEDLRQDILNFARQRLGSALAPSEIAFCSTLPKTRTGKVLRRRLRARELGLFDADTAWEDDDSVLSSTSECDVDAALGEHDALAARPDSPS